MRDVSGCERRAEIAVVLVRFCEEAEAVGCDCVFNNEAGSAGGVRGPAGEAISKVKHQVDDSCACAQNALHEL